MKWGNIFALVLSSCIVSVTYGQDTQCPTHYYNGQAPVIHNAKMQNKARELCFIGYANMHSGLTRTGLWSAEHLTKENLEQGSQLKRINAFHPEYALPEEERAALKDYVRTGYDKGHLAPSKDFATREAQQESFSLANMVPQNPKNNRQLWEGIESAVRTLAKRRGEIYIITGPIFSKTENIDVLHGRVSAPTQLYKIVVDPRKQQGAAYLVDNIATMDYKVISIAELESISEITFFPSMPEKVKKTVMRLPKPTPHGKKSLMNDLAELFN